MLLYNYMCDSTLATKNREGEIVNTVAVTAAAIRTAAHFVLSPKLKNCENEQYLTLYKTLMVGMILSYR